MQGDTGKVEEMVMKNPEREWNIEHVTEVLMDCFSHIMHRSPLQPYRVDVEMFNKNVYSSLLSFYTLVSVFQTIFLVFLGDDIFLIFQAQLRSTAALGNVNVSGRNEDGGNEREMDDELMDGCSL